MEDVRIVPHTNWENKTSGVVIKTKEIPCLTGKGAPTPATVGAVGCLYMDTDSGAVYKCTAASDGVYTWGDALDSAEMKRVIEAYLEANPPADGEDGGHYTPVVTQPTADTMKVEFAPSKAGMAAVEPVTVKLPVGDGTDSGQNLSVFAGKSASFYGDSLTEKNGHYTKGYHQWIKELLGLASYNNYGVSGYNVSDVYNKVNTVADTADIVFVMCGVNDQTHSVPLGEMGDTTIDTTYGALNLLCGVLKAKYPTSIIVFITPHYQIKYPHSSGVTSYEVSKAIREVCENYAIPVYDNFVLGGIYPTNLSVYTTDNCHWNDKGHEMVGKNLAAYMLDTFHYVYSANSGGEEGGDTTDPENPETPATGKTVEVTGGSNMHLCLYATAEDLPSIDGDVEWGLTITPQNFTLGTMNSAGGFYMTDAINDLNAGFTQAATAVKTATLTDNGDGTCTISQIFETQSFENGRNYWCFPLRPGISKGNKFTLHDSYIRVAGQDVPVHAIGGAFNTETVSIT